MASTDALEQWEQCLRIRGGTVFIETINRVIRDAGAPESGDQ